MTLEEEVAACFPAWLAGAVGEIIPPLVALIRQREKQWVEEVGRLKVDRHFAYLAQEAAHAEVVQERGELQDRIEELERQLSGCQETLEDDREYEKNEPPCW